MTRVVVEVAVPEALGYQVVVGRDLGSSIGEVVSSSRRVALIYPPDVAFKAAKLAGALADLVEITLIPVPDAEQQKTAVVAATCWEALGTAGFTRTDTIVGIGGGATTDLAGFVAATWLRGVRIVHVPTTLLAMVDASIGGKAGINTAAGKNLVGAFHTPSAVFCDLDSLATLPKADLVAGLAEVVKVGFTHDSKILSLIESDPKLAADPNGPVLVELIERSITVKASVVGADLRELLPGGREILNYGHTLGHAIERLENYGWRHGEAVSVGLVFAAELGRAAGHLSDATVDRHRSILQSLSLPTTYPGARWLDLLQAMQLDKKKRGDVLRFVVIDDVCKPRVLAGVDPEVLAAAYAEVSI